MNRVIQTGWWTRLVLGIWVLNCLACARRLGQGFTLVYGVRS
jgi:hypothetical protein